MSKKYYQQIISSIKNISEIIAPNSNGFGLKYMGTDKPSYHLDTATIRNIAKQFLKENDLTLEEFESLTDSLYEGDSCDEVFIAAKIIEFSTEHKKTFDLSHLDKWLDHVHGWAETDTLCQMAFTDEDLLSRWTLWQKTIKNFSKDKNVHKRRASLVLLTKPVRLSPDPRLSELAFANVEKLKGETDILITKAVSWLLRALIKYHKDEVAQYLKRNENSLPKIAIREVTSKLDTGKKYINKKKQDGHR